jgi:alpha-tubulin suppressor-like RCC1 family protein
VVVIAAALGGCGRIGFDGREPELADADASAFRAIVAYANQTCALLGGRAWCWGDNGQGQIAGANALALSPVEVKLPAGEVVRISQGEGHACAIVRGAAEQLYCWGRGIGEMPVEVALPGPPKEVACGRDFTCAIADKVHCWGINDAGQLGDLMNATRDVPAPINSTKTTFTALRAGDDHACADEPSGIPECWGHNDEGTLGTGSFTPAEARSPVAVVGGITTLPLIAGWHACALEGGEVFCWGRNAEGELGNANQIPTATPEQVPGLMGVTAIATGGGPTTRDASCAILVGGNMMCWGAGAEGRLGNGDTSDALVPVDVVGLPERALTAAIGYEHTCAIVESGDVYCWGNGDKGQLGDGRGAGSLAPVRVTRPP